MSDDKGIDFLLETVEQEGVACSTVADGHVFIFKRNHLVDLLEKNPGSGNVVIFVKKRDFKN